MKALFASLALLMCPLACTTLAEEHGCCAGCGQRCCLKPVCRLVCAPATVVEVCYDCHCEDFCTMGPSKKCGDACEPDGCGHLKKRTLWQPSCGHVRHRHVLLKLEVERQVPHYECVVEHVCDRCCGTSGRVPCDQAARLAAAAQEMNRAPGRAAPPESAQTASDAHASPRRPFWTALFAR